MLYSLTHPAHLNKLFRYHLIEALLKMIWSSFVLRFSVNGKQPCVSSEKHNFSLQRHTLLWWGHRHSRQRWANGVLSSASATWGPSLGLFYKIKQTNVHWGSTRRRHMSWDKFWHWSGLTRQHLIINSHMGHMVQWRIG